MDKLIAAAAILALFWVMSSEQYGRGVERHIHKNICRKGPLP